MLGRLEDGRRATAVAYLGAQAARRDFAARVDAAAQQVDVLLAPTTLTVAPPRAGQTVTIDNRPPIPIREALLAPAVPFSQLGWPAVSVPAGPIDSLPFGAQVIARPGAESTLLRTAAAVESLTP